MSLIFHFDDFNQIRTIFHHLITFCWKKECPHKNNLNTELILSQMRSDNTHEGEIIITDILINEIIKPFLSQFLIKHRDPQKFFVS
jgi:hypothetical protein